MVTEKARPAARYGRLTKLVGALLIVSFAIQVVVLLGQGANPSGLLFAAFALGIYFLPAWYAHYKQHPQAEAIAVLNLLAGWTVVGWIAAAVWASYKPNA